MIDRERTGGATPEESRDDLIAALFESYVDRLSAGERLDRDELRRLHPDFAEELLADLETLAGLGAERSGDGAGETFGDYRVLSRIGSGGMGIVYEAWDESMERHVALKVLPENLLSNARVVARFVKEARIAGKLNHPNIVHVYGMGVDRGGPYYAMEFVEGRTLARALAELRPSGVGEGRGIEHWHRSALALGRLLGGSAEDREGEATVPLARASLEDDSGGLDLAYCIQTARAFADVADALSYAHRRGVVHRDLKPSNLMIDIDGRLRVLDFGLARREGEESLTVSGDLIGTLLYMSPEQAASSRVHIDHRTDIYSLGATLYEALTFRPPFSGRDHRDLIGKILSADPQPPRRLEPRIPRDLETIVLKCLQKDARDRYLTAEALAQDLRRFARGDPTEARPRSRIETLVRRAWRRKGVVAATGAFLLLAIAAAVLLRIHLEERSRLLDASYERSVLDAMALLEYDQSRPPGRAQVIEITDADPALSRGVAFAMETDSEGDVGPDPAREALRILREASRLLPERPEAIFHAARALERLGRKEEALELLAPLVVGAGAFAPAVIWCGAHASDETHGEARAPEHGWERAYVVAQLAARERRWEDAETAYSELLEAFEEAGDPYLGARFEARLARGVARLELDRYLEAVEDFAAAHELVPGSLEPVLLLGKVYLERRMPEVAERRLHALDAAPPGGQATQRVFALLLDFQEYGRALEWARRIDDRATRRMAEARAIAGLGQLSEALAAAEEALTLAGEDPRAHRTLGHVLARSGELEAAINAYRQAIRIDEEDADTWLELGRVLSLARRHDEARRVYETVLARDSGSIEALASIGWNFAEAGQPEEALRWLEKARALDPRSLAARNVYAYTLGALGRVDEAIAEYEALIELYPDQDILYTNLAIQFNRKKMRPQAEAACRKALEVDPNNDEAYKILGASAFHQGRVDEAIELLEKCVELDRSDFSGWFYVAYAYETKGDTEKAIDAYRRSVELNKRDVRASYNLGNVYMGLGRLEEAVEAYQKALENDPDHAYAHINTAIVLFQLEKLDEAAHHLEEALRLNKEDSDTYWNLAAVREKQGRLAEAIDLQRQGIARAPGDARPLGDLAAWLERAGDLTGAIEARLSELEIYAGQRRGGQLAGDAIESAVGTAADHLAALLGAAEATEERRAAATRAAEFLRAFGDDRLVRYVEAVEALR